MADPEILKINAGFVLRKKSNSQRRRLPAEVIALLTPEAQRQHLAETDEPMQVDLDDDPVQPGLNPNEVDADIDDGLDDLVIIVEDP